MNVAGGIDRLVCPVCAGRLDVVDGSLRCARNHTFNLAREGYVNLLRSSKSADRTGDPKEAARSRREFLDRGYYAPLRDRLVRRLCDEVMRGGASQGASASALLDICCGEGYYTSAFGGIEGLVAYGFDLSREMVRLAAKRGGATYFVANLRAVPVADASFDLATHLFAPFHEAEFARVLKPGGLLLTVVPGARHLFGLKERLYDTPYENDERLPQTALLELVGTDRVRSRVRLETQADIEAVFQMTPYYYRTREQDRAKLAGLTSLETEIDFVIGEYRKLP